ncbi:hypothetical protein BJP34_20425 [Moorena producens PAL-8-15-08-1]|uniref:Uncharacterized protein n=1 Tax=Moorena producens PAL-8-15-08-1 TaxID=1458985 RepID=A0A1D8TVD6_9CYAN|nr:hypothetical protein [Moorena producens]AOX01495.1 hypothetical protein BJP34_20425 [Moorena producens PAL-8-15-08-1]
MNLSPELQREIEQISISQGISPEQFILETLIEKISSLKQQSVSSITISTEYTQQNPHLQNKDGILVIETATLDQINFNDLIDQLRAERDQEQLCL